MLHPASTQKTPDQVDQMTTSSDDIPTCDIQTFDSRGHSKSQGVNFTISYPGAFVAYEATGDSIIQKFIDHKASKTPQIKIILDRISDQPVSCTDIELYLTEKELRSSLPALSRVIACQPDFLCGQVRGAAIEYITIHPLQKPESKQAAIQSIPGPNCKQSYSKNYLFFWKQYMLIIQCQLCQSASAGDLLAKLTALRESFDTYREVFDTVATSLKIELS